MTGVAMDMREEGTASVHPLPNHRPVPRGRRSVLNAPRAAAGRAQREGGALGLGEKLLGLLFVFLCVCFSFFFSFGVLFLLLAISVRFQVL